MPRQGNDIKDAAIVRYDRSRRDFHRQLRHRAYGTGLAGSFDRSKLQNDALKRGYGARAPPLLQALETLNALEITCVLINIKG